MVSVSIKVSGLDKARSLLGNLAAAAVHVNGPIISLASAVPYAYGIETGRHRGGRRARRAGGAFMFRDAITAMRPRVAPAIGKALFGGTAAVQRAKADLNRQAVEDVRKRTPVRSGRLRDSVRESGRPS